MKLAVLFLTINYKMKTMLIIMSEMQIKFKARLFMLKLIGPFKMQGVGITICKTIWHHEIFFMSKLLQWLRLHKDTFPECKIWFVLRFCAISPIRKHKQCLRMSLTFNNFNIFLVGINMFKFNKKNTGRKCEICWKLTIKTPEWHKFAVSIFNSWAYFTPCSSSFKVDFEQSNAGWGLLQAGSLQLYKN